MVSWSADGTLAGYDGVTRQWKADAYVFDYLTPGAVPLDGPTRLGVPLAASFGTSAPFRNRLMATASITITSGDVTTYGLHSGFRIGVTMWVVSDSFFPPGVVPTMQEIYATSQENGQYIQSTTSHYTAGTRTYNIYGPRPQQGGRYWVAVIPSFIADAGENLDPYFYVDLTLGRALSIWTNRAPNAPSITSPNTGTVTAPGDTFTLEYETADPDGQSPDDDQRLNRDLAGVEFQYAAQPTVDNPSPEWLPLPFRAASGSGKQRSWEIKGTASLDIDAAAFAYLREDLGAEVLCGVDAETYPGAAGMGLLPSGDWQIRCRTFDFGHPYPLVARPLGAALGGLGGPTPDTYPAQNISPWSAAVQVSVPAQVLPPVAVYPKDNVAVAFEDTPRLTWQYRNTATPPFEQFTRTVQIRKVGDPDWATVFDGVSGNYYVDLPPSFGGDPDTDHEYLTDLSFEGGGLDDWNAVIRGGSGTPTLTNVNSAPDAHTGNRSLHLVGPVGGLATAERHVVFREQDTEFEFTGWVAPDDTLNFAGAYLFWYDEDDNLLSSQLIWYRYLSPGSSWGGYVPIETSPDPFTLPNGPVSRPAGAVSADIVVLVRDDADPLGTASDLWLDDVSFIGHSPASDPFDLDISTRYEWRVKTGDTTGEVSGYSTPARFWVVPNAASGDSRPTTTDLINGATLGCGTHRVEVYKRGGKVRVGEIRNISYLDWARVRDDISTAKIVVSGWDIDCGNLLSLLQTWAYEVVITRDNGFSKERVWEGPITLLKYEHDTVTINAKDVMGYAYRRIIKQKMSDAGLDPLKTVVDRARRVIQNVFAPDDPNVLAYLQVIYNDDDAKQFRSTPAYSRTGFEEVDDMASNAGLDYTTVGRSILLWGTKHRIGTLPEFKDADLGEFPIVSEYGMSMANRYAVSDGNGIYGEATRLDEDGNDPVYGLVEMLSSTWASDSPADTGTYTQEGVQTMIQQFEEFAERSISDRYPAPVVVRLPDNTTLNPSAVISIQQLVPGVVIPLRSSATLREVVGNQKLDSIKVVETEGKETVSITMSAFNRDDVETATEGDG